VHPSDEKTLDDVLKDLNQATLPLSRDQKRVAGSLKPAPDPQILDYLDRRLPS